jgi:hypothetical protein
MLIVPTLKIAGLGAGTFIIILMIVIGIIISLVGYQTNKPAYVSYAVDAHNLVHTHSLFESQLLCFSVTASLSPSVSFSQVSSSSFSRQCQRVASQYVICPAIAHLGCFLRTLLTRPCPVLSVNRLQERSDDDIDPMWSKRVGITTLLSVFAAVGLVMLLVHYVMAPVKASRLR